jgi:DNA polymerase elongation subunit (family B)
MDMLQHLSNSVEEFIEADTDGIYAKIRKDKIPEVLKIIKEFEDRVSLAFEIEIIKSGLIILDNIHDYIIMSESESTVSIYDNEEKLIKFGVKAKGKYKYYEGPNATHCDYPCVVKAVVDYIAYKVPINVTFEKLIQEEKFL